MLYDFLSYAAQLAFLIGQIILVMTLLELYSKVKGDASSHRIKPIKKHKDVKASKEQLKYQTLLKNIDNYDGTSRGQEDLDG